MTGISTLHHLVQPLHPHPCWTNQKRGSGGDLAAVDSLVVEEVEGGEQSGTEDN